MSAIKLCKECWKPLTTEDLLGLCPECMMKAGLPSPGSPTVQVAPDAFVEPPETETKQFAPGAILGYCGDYELLEEIARGGMGVVYKARQSSLKRIVAVKTIRAGGLASEAEVQRFRTEAQAAAQLQHPNIVPIHEIGEDHGRHYFSMDFVEGKNLAQIADGRPVAARQAAQWLKTIAEAVQYAHQRGVLHRDLKPQNIMVDAAGRPRVTDFGLAKILSGDSTLTHTGAVMGSPSYMSPEQARGRNDLVGPASDVYALGAILYELLAGRPPFRGKTPLETLSEVVNDEPRPPHALNPGAPKDLETICLKCLDKDPVRRYPTARELELDLARFLAGETVQARPADTLRKMMGWARRHRSLFAMAASLLVLALLGLAYGLWEQTKYLTWLNAHPNDSAQHAKSLDWLKAHPDYAQRVGLRPRDFNLGIPLPVEHDERDFGSLVSRAWIISLVFFPVLRLSYRLLARGASWKRFFEPLRRAPSPGVALAFGATTALAVAGTLFLTAKWIKVTVWQGPSYIFQFIVALFVIYPLFAFWFSFLLTIVRDQRRIYIGPGKADVEAALSPQQFDAIRGALSAGKFHKAVKNYRAATGTPSAEARQRVQEMAEGGLSDQELAAIHQELFAGHVAQAAHLFRDATRLPENLVRSSIGRLQLQLYRSHPGQFTGGRFEKTAMAQAQRRVWQALGIILVFGLGISLLPQFRPELITLGAGVACGVFLRGVQWTQGYRRMGFVFWLAMWFLLLMVSLWLVIAAVQLFFLLGHPYDPMGPMALLLPGTLAGWLWIHLSLKYPTKVSSSRTLNVAAKVKRFFHLLLRRHKRP